MLNWHLKCGTAGSYSVFRLRVSTDLVVVETRNIHHRYSVDGISSDIPSRDTSGNIFHEILRVSSPDTEYVESEYENIPCFDAPQGTA